ncbi:Alpha/Beta hydrolase protein [Penicillium chermesinum]|uniref:Carboxylic ester hydrolase n=1 Tax=Penicillium chermesinum TaxID=63820 RepID=A0A9W9PH29_9EURO|nr:Alpha/Beta hydrolase protein [Penicillium chermesinum]KAJ5246708.1 Alpha/Beta hydrolase protein [Penicillium chermesinum]KAJ6144979.1 Alpha/Beta hydrolase protein [Penicillium chermesinum]
MQFLVSLLWLASVGRASSKATSDSALTVKTNTGIFTGVQNSYHATVREFRNIPYAQSPVGKFRFLPPETLPHSDEHIYSTRFPPSCPQFEGTSPSFWNTYGTYFLPQNGNQNHSNGQSLQTGSEDCLRLAIWTPYHVAKGSKLPVIVWLPGGGFTSGGVDVICQKPQSWVSRTQGHIVVSVNYRVGIFGFPNAAGSDSPNVGLLDQRKALEWVHENIEAFGGDPEAITLWGQSAGAISTDYHNYAYWDNPIVRSSFSQSGTALKGTATEDYSHTNFTFVAKSLGCDFPNNPKAELQCFQNVPATQITNFIGTTNETISFNPIIDEKLVFSNYTARAAEGKLANIPSIYSDVANNDATLAPWPSSNVTVGPWEPAIVAGTLSGWVCATANTSNMRHAANRLTYRYQYAGRWSHVEPFPWLGAYHSSDNPMIYGTYWLNTTNATTGPTEAEAQTSETMQDMIFAFLKDPVKGPPALGWLPYTYGSNVLRFGADGVPVQNVSGYEIDGPCYGNGTYNPYP